MKNAIILGTLLFCAGSVRADDIPPIKPSHVFKLTPPAIQKATPKGAKILETASFPIGPNRSDVLVHLYGDAPSHSSSSDVDGIPANTLLSGGLDLFVQRGAHLTRIRSFKFERPDEEEEYSDGGTVLKVTEPAPFTVGEVHWLDTKKTKPIITLFVPGYRGEEGSYVFFVFNKGLMQAPARQNFRYWKDLYGRREIEFISYDKHGNLTIADRFFDDMADNDINRSNILYLFWDGSKFK